MHKAAHVVAGRSFLVRRCLVLVAATVASLGTFASIPAAPAAAAPPAPVSAEGNSYALGASISILGGTPINIGPIAPATANVPSPPNPKFDQSGTVICNGNCVASLVNSLNVTNDTGKAFVPGYSGGGGSTAATDCLPGATLPAGFTLGPLTGGNGCSTIAQAALLAGNVGTTGIVAGAVYSQSVTQSCTGTPANGGQIGNVSIANLSISGVNVIGGNGPLVPTNTPAPNTAVTIPGVATVILNEQKFENLSGGTNTGTTTGHGLIVNAAHIIVNIALLRDSIVQADIILGHSSSRAICDQAVASECPIANVTGQAQCPGNPIAKTVVTPGGSGTNGNPPIAHPGDTVIYTVSIANPVDCRPLTQVVDTLPPGFAFVSASGNLGTSPAIGSAGGQVTVTFQSATGFSTADPLVETIVAQVGAGVPPGTYVNGVDVLSFCGETPGSGGGVIVPANPATAAPAVPNTNLPNTSAGGFVPGSQSGLVLLLMGALGAMLLAASAAWRLVRHSTG